jgi:GT2 family glycosyltransferase
VNDRLPVLDAVVVAHGDEPALAACLTTVLASHGVVVRVALVDNGCTRPDLDELCADDRVTLIRPGTNLGFAAGCNHGAAALDGDVVVLLNSDATVDPCALRHLADGLGLGVGMTTACVLLADAPDVVNAAGVAVHPLLLSWADGWGDAVDRHREPRDVASASGAALAVPRSLWEELGGFDEELFLYGEDVELSLRVWQQGLRVRYLPAARVWHAYAFDRNAAKRYYLERNRWRLLLTVLETKTLLLLSPVLVPFELALLLAAVRDRAVKAKLRAALWNLKHLRSTLRRRALVQRSRRLSDAALVGVLHPQLDSPALQAPGVEVVSVLVHAYWSRVRHRIGRGSQ